MDIIFEEQPYLANVYPGDTRSIGIIFCIDRAEVEYFNLGVNPIFRDTYTLGGGTITKKGYNITEKCIGCGKNAKNVLQRKVSRKENRTGYCKTIACIAATVMKTVR